MKIKRKTGTKPHYSLRSILYPLFFLAVALGHLTLLHLPYYWDEGGYYIPAALDFYHHGWLVPHFTNAHTPLPSIVLGTLWHVFGCHILVTRLTVCAFAAAGLLAVFRLTQRLLGDSAALAVTLLTAVYPIWFAQSTLAHADIFAAAFTLWAFALYLPATQLATGNWQLQPHSSQLTAQQSPRRLEEIWVPRVRILGRGTDHRRLLLIALLFTLAVLSKETSIVQPAALAALELYLLLRNRKDPALRRGHLQRLAALSFPVIPLLLWFAWHHHSTGFTFGNPEYLRYNATANFNLGHVLTSIYYRFLHLVWQRNIWLPILFAFACLLLPRRSAAGRTGAQHLRSKSFQNPGPWALGPGVTRAIALVIAANWLAFSVLGGALLTRYLLPVYPLILLVCVATWRAHIRLWLVFAVVTAAAFISAWWLNPPTSFAPEDNLTYRDMIVVHQQAIDYVAQNYPDATVLTAWPVAADLFRPELGYVSQPIKAFSIEDFTRTSILKATREPGRYDTAIVFTTHFTAPAFRRWLLDHPGSAQGHEFAVARDLTPREIAVLLGGHVVKQFDRNGEWAAVLRFDRSYEAGLDSGSLGLSRIHLTGHIQ